MIGYALTLLACSIYDAAIEQTVLLSGSVVEFVSYGSVFFHLIVDAICRCTAVA